MKKTYSVILLVIIFIFLTTYNSNHLNTLKEKKNIFFKIKNVEIINNNLIEEKKIYEKLNHIYQKNIFLIKRKDIEDSLKQIDFLSKIEVKKKYPNTIIVKIFETRPIAIIFKKNKKYILDSSSNLIIDENYNIYDKLPNIFGEGAEYKFVNFYQKLQKFNFPKEKVQNFYYFKINRWDIELKNNQLVKLPPNKVKEAIKQSIELLNNKDFNKYNIIDLRVYGKVVVE